MTDIAEKRSLAARALARVTNAWAVYSERRLLVMLLLGFSSGLPFLLVFGTLSAWLRTAGISRTEIGLMSYVGLAYTIKFLWAPLIDQIRLPWLSAKLGKRRAWIVLAQAVIAAALVAISFCDPAASLMPVAILAVVLAFASATQDISIDAWRIEAAPDEQQGAMAAAYQLGYRFAIIASGAGALYIADFVSWHAAYLAMAVLMAIGFGAALFAPRLDERAAPVVGEDRIDAFAERFDVHGRARKVVAWIYRALFAPFIDFFGRHGWFALAILALIGLYRVPDFVLGVMANPLYIDLGFSLAEIATVVKVFGVWMTILGAIAGGLVIASLGIMRSLLIGATAVILTNFMFSWLAMQGADLTALTVTISAENFSGGFAGTCLIAYMSSLTSHEFTATQYALFSSVYALPGKLLGGMSGIMVDHYGAAGPIRDFVMAHAPSLTEKTAGYVPFFLTTGSMGLPAIALILYLRRYDRPAKPV
ncbi:MFS transporter [Parvibaculum sp.]|uniref:AmpG family muropeptide MFS transporter n=1 Tax=Parvibaculum sp. TaxID=2024848 RepID=UPI0025E13809|nr:MFS transporter [Parvibaculum sp.]